MNEQLLKDRWFWIALGTGGYLASLYAILLGLGHGIAVIGFPLVLLPLAFRRFALSDRLRAVALICLFGYLVLLLILIRSSYFPDDVAMYFELFFVLLITIPSFLIRSPLYLVFGATQSIDTILIISGCIFLVLFGFGVKHVIRFNRHSQMMMLSVVLLSIFVTCTECLTLGEGIKRVTAENNVDRTLRDYYRVALTEFGD